MMLRHKRYDVRQRRLGMGRIEVYWRCDELGSGPCASVYVGRRERLRFDLFSPAHMHLATDRGSPRHFYPDGLELAEYILLATRDLVRHHPPAAKACAWVAEQLASVTGPIRRAPG